MNGNDTITGIGNEKDERARERGLELATHCQITHKDGIWYVPDVPRRNFRFRVKLDPPYCICTCLEFAETGQPCCHIYAARIAERRMRGEPVPARVYPAVVPAGAPSWVTAELIQDTLRTLQAEYPERLNPDDALVMILSISRLFDVDRDGPGRDEPNKVGQTAK